MRDQFPSVFRLNDTREVARNKLGRGALINEFPDTPDALTFVPEDANYPELVPENDDILAILRDIRNLLRSHKKLPPFFAEQIKTLPALANSSLTIEATEQFRTIWIPRTPRAIIVYAGMGRALPIASLDAGESLRATLPYPVQGVTVEWTTAAQIDYLHILLTSESMSVEVVAV